MGSKIKYFDMGPWPVNVGFTQDEEKFRAELIRLGYVDGPDMIPSASGNAGTHRLPTKPITFIIAMQPDISDYDYAQVAGLLAHEATHVMRWFFKSIGERKPSAEAQASFVQWIVQGCLGVIEENVIDQTVSHRKSKKRKNSKARCEFEGEAAGC